MTQAFLGRNGVHKTTWPEPSLTVQKGHTKVNIKQVWDLMWRTPLSDYKSYKQFMVSSQGAARLLQAKRLRNKYYNCFNGDIVLSKCPLTMM